MPGNIEPSELLQRAKDGDKEAFGELYRLYFTPIYRYLFIRLRSRERADDLAQDVFLKIFAKVETLREIPLAPLSYFFTVARNTLIDFWRKKKDLSLENENETAAKVPDGGADLLENLARAEVAAKVRQGLAALPAEEAEIVALKYFGGLSAREIGQSLGLSEEAVRQRQCRALKKLRVIFK